jgi:hypothetical protein
VDSICGRCPVIRILGIGRGNLFEDDVDLSCLEAGELHVVAEVDEVLQFLCKLRPIPAGKLSQTVIRYDVRALLGFAEVLNPNCRYAVPAQLLDGIDPGVPRKYGVFPIDNDRAYHAKLQDRGCQLSYLSFGVDSCVGRIRP